jgi:hypothetical protein
VWRVVVPKLDSENSKKVLSKPSKNTNSYGKVKYSLSPLKDPKPASHREQSSKVNKDFNILFDSLKGLINNPDQRMEASMALIYHVWEEGELDSLLDLFASLKTSNKPKAKINIRYDDDNIVFSTPKKTLKIDCNRDNLHHIFSYSSGPIDTVAKINYHNRNSGPVDSPDEIKYLSDSPGPIDTLMELLYQVRNEGQVDTVFEWYRLVRNSGDISSVDEIKYHNQNPGPQDTMGERLLRTKNTGPVDTDDERSYYNPKLTPVNSGSKALEQEEDLPIFNPRPNPYPKKI